MENNLDHQKEVGFRCIQIDFREDEDFKRDPLDADRITMFIKPGADLWIKPFANGVFIEYDNYCGWHGHTKFAIDFY